MDDIVVVWFDLSLNYHPKERCIDQLTFSLFVLKETQENVTIIESSARKSHATILWFFSQYVATHLEPSTC